MATYETNCLYSIVENTSGATLKFGYLGEHGKSLANAGQHTQLGNIVDAISRKEKRARDAFVRDVAAGRLAIVSTPAAVVYDDTQSASSILTADNGNMTLSPPCWTVEA